MDTSTVAPSAANSETTSSCRLSATPTGKQTRPPRLLMVRDNYHQHNITGKRQSWTYLALSALEASSGEYTNLAPWASNTDNIAVTREDG
jgi:hypothetical protein